MKLLDEIIKHEEALRVEITTKSEEMESFGEPIANDLDNNTAHNIPLEVGEFLDVVMGDKVTTQRSSVLNKVYFASDGSGANIKKKANDAGQTLEEYIDTTAKANANRYYGSSNFQDAPFFITAGRGFGISYVVGKTARKQSKFADKNSIFYYLTKEHIDCVRNARKKECVKDFYDFKQEFLKALEAITRTVIVPISEQIDTISLYNNTFHNKELRNETHRSILGDDNTVTLKHCEIVTSVPATWDKITKFHNKRNDNTNMSLFAINIIREDEDGQTRGDCIGTFKMVIKEAYDDTSNKMVNYNTFNSYTKLLTEINHDQDSRTTFYGRRNRENTWSSSDRSMGNDIIRDMKAILDKPEIKAEIDKRINLYKEYSVKLLELKHKYADLYFVESNF